MHVVVAVIERDGKDPVDLAVEPLGFSLDRLLEWKRFDASLEGVVIVGNRALYGISQKHDELRFRKQGTDSVWRERVGEVVGGCLTSQRLPPQALPHALESLTGGEVGAVPSE